MKKCRSHYHYLLHSLKKIKIKIAISKKVLKNNNYWKTMRVVRKNNFNTTNSVDRHIGGKHIANNFNMYKYIDNYVNTNHVTQSRYAHNKIGILQ